MNPFVLPALSALLLFSACARKQQPAGSTVRVTEKEETAPVRTPGRTMVKRTTASVPAARPAIAKTPAKAAAPKVILVNIKAAKKSVDGRYYYDFEGKRYWRNKKDGKFYLYNKSMYGDPNFKP